MNNIFSVKALIFFSLILAALYMAGPAVAQSRGEFEPDLSAIEADYTARPYYDALVRELIERRSEYFNFSFLRGRYTMIRAYDPAGEEARDALLRQAFIVDTSHDRDEIEAAIDEFHRIVREHMGNITVVTQALALSKQDRRLGNPDFYKFVRQGLFANVLNSGTGRSLNEAYDVIAPAEETMLLAHLDVDVLDTVRRKSGSVYYNIHSVVDRRTERPYTIFVNTTKIMQHKRKQDSETTYIQDIPKQ